MLAKPRDGIIYRLRMALSYAAGVTDAIGSFDPHAYDLAAQLEDELEALVGLLEQAIAPPSFRLRALRVLRCTNCGCELADTSLGSVDTSARACPACGSRQLHPIRVDLFTPAEAA
ncbi:MAG TPA: hypothetical protein VNI55_01755 [Gaiellaceae bacterium]|nr:hypothetical protein [Gaiellaceae bacterium]